MYNDIKEIRYLNSEDIEERYTYLRSLTSI